MTHYLKTICFALALFTSLIPSPSAFAQVDYFETYRFGTEDHFWHAASLTYPDRLVGLGYATGGNNTDLISCFNLDGTVRWSKALDTLLPNYYELGQITAQDAVIFTAGEYSGNFTGFNVIRWDSTGSIDWSKPYTSSAFADIPTAEDVLVNTRGGLYVGGQLMDVIWQAEGFLASLMPSSGVPLWGRKFNVGDQSEILVTSLGELPTTDFLAAGILYDPPITTYQDVFISCWNNQGGNVWFKRLHHADYLRPVTVTADSHAIYLVCNVESTFQPVQAVVAKFDLMGNLLHWKALNDPSDWIFATDMVMNGLGPLLVLEDESGTTNYHGQIVQLDSTLTLQWMATLEDMDPAGIGSITPSNQLLIAGSNNTDPNFPEQLAIAKYDIQLQRTNCDFTVDVITVNPYTLPAVSGPTLSMSVVGLDTAYEVLTTINMPLMRSLSCTPTAVDDTQTNGLTAWPNPAYGNVKVSVEGPEGKIFVYGMDGKLWKSKEMDDVEEELDLSELPAGVYLLQHLNAEGTRTLKLALTK